MAKIFGTHARSGDCGALRAADASLAAGSFDRADSRYAVVAGVLFVMALPLEARAMWRTVRRPTAPLLGVVPGEVRYFQVWYRDPAGFPEPYNLSDAVALTFLP